jgi:hypothetical protein
MHDSRQGCVPMTEPPSRRHPLSGSVTSIGQQWPASSVSRTGGWLVHAEHAHTTNDATAVRITMRFTVRWCRSRTIPSWVAP